jgi:DNA-binding XRE family transcriptional regulator
MKAYQESKLSNAMNNLGVFYDFAANDLNIDGETISNLFVNSLIANEFQDGNPKYIEGKSGIELVYDVIKEHKSTIALKKPLHSSSISKEYWAGQALAYLQWSTSRSFRDIFNQISYSQILSMYNPYHEVDLRKFVEDVVDDFYLETTNLRLLRNKHKLSQEDLAIKVGISKRSIEMYEQRKNDINKAQAMTIFNLSKILNCDMEDLLE